MHPTALSRGEPALTERLAAEGHGPLWPVHRLDRPTAGLMVLARHPGAAAVLNRAFREGRIEKTYEAWVRGWCPSGEESSALDDPDRSGERQALTRFVLLERYEAPQGPGPHPSFRFSRVEVCPQTGRRHQIRRHLRRAAHPLLGDTLYGDGRVNAWVRSGLGFSRLALWASSLQFAHPGNGSPLRLKADPARFDPDYLVLKQSASPWLVPEL